MIYRTNQNVSLPALGFGTAELRGDLCREAVLDALNIGYRHFDTARAYQNETEVGQAIANSAVPREQIFLTSKLWKDMLTPDRVRQETEQSLADLHSDYLDLLLIHWPNESVPVQETLSAMTKLASEGMVKHIGVSNFSVAQLEEANEHAAIFCNQVPYDPFTDQRPLLSYAREANILIVAYSPLAGGRVFSAPELEVIGSRYGKDPGQIALRWLIQQPNVAALTRSADSEHRRRSFDIFDFDLTPEEVSRINFLTKSPPQAED